MEVSKELGKELKFDIKFENSKLKVELFYDGKGVDGSVAMYVEPEYFIKKLTDAIPGEWDDMAAAALLAAMKRD